MYNYISLADENLSGFGRRSMNLQEARRKLSAYRVALKNAKPTSINTYINILNEAVKSLDLAERKAEVTDKADKDKLWFAKFWLESERSRLQQLEGFYRKGKARQNPVHIESKAQGHTKERYVYQQHKGMAPGKIRDKIDARNKQESGKWYWGDDYLNWVNNDFAKNNQIEYLDHSSDTVYLATKYALVNQAEFLKDRVRPRKTFDTEWGEEISINRIILRDGMAKAVHTLIDDVSPRYFKLGTKRGRIPVVVKMHTLKTPISVTIHDTPNTEVSYQAYREHIDPGGELPCSLKYAMRSDKLYFLGGRGLKLEKGAAASHGAPVDFKSVQAAGGIVIDQGKVLAIDNVSGHYEPGWKLLIQAVRLIDSAKCFDERAVVGLMWSKPPKVTFMPCSVFIGLCEGGFSDSSMQSLIDSVLEDTRSHSVPEVGDHIKKHWWKAIGFTDHYRLCKYCRENRT